MKNKYYICFIIISFFLSSCNRFELYRSLFDCPYNYIIYYDDSYKRIYIDLNYGTDINLITEMSFFTEVDRIVKTNEEDLYIYVKNDDQSTIKKITVKAVKLLNEINNKKCIKA